MKKPWYHEGLSFTCQRCGRCCRGRWGYVWVTEEEIQRLAQALSMELEAFGKRYLRRYHDGYALVDGPDGACIFLTPANQCRVYEVRPLQCRTYPWWPEYLTSLAHWEAQQRICPGIGTGPRIPYSVIQTQLALATSIEPV